MWNRQKADDFSVNEKVISLIYKSFAKDSLVFMLFMVFKVIAVF